MFFKVEVGEGNIVHNWRSYTVKRITDCEDVIKRFMILHNIKVVYIYLITFAFIVYCKVFVKKSFLHMYRELVMMLYMSMTTMSLL
jgi:hypothetical protein